MKEKDLLGISGPEENHSDEFLWFVLFCSYIPELELKKLATPEILTGADF